MGDLSDLRAAAEAALRSGDYGAMVSGRPGARASPS
jgi:hypothetical protein